MKNTKMLRTLGASCLLALCASLNADDTEICQSPSEDCQRLSRSKVLIIYDNSGSMRTNVPGQKPAYDPYSHYYDSVHDGDRIYWSTNGEPPAEDTDSYYFVADKNRCAESAVPLATTGYFQTKARRWETSDADSWNSLSTSDRDPIHVDCQVDVINDNDENPGTTIYGFPRKPAGDDATPDEEYSANTPAESDVDWGNNAYTFYSAHYMDWYHDDSLGTPDRTRIDIAQEMVTNMINANPGIDFGLEVFNYNFPNDAPYHGGRIVRRIINDMSTADRASLVDMVDDLVAQTSTPLCESAWEAYSYIAGKEVEGGDNKRFSDTPDRDLAAESGGTYIRPFQDCGYFYIIMITDGRPQNDFASNQAIKDLTEDQSRCAPEGTTGYPNFEGALVENCLPRLTHYMANTDLDGDATNGDQFGITYTIGLPTDGTDQQLLEDAAVNGKGQYYSAQDAESLPSAFQKVIVDILSRYRDTDGDGVSDDNDNCPCVANADQANEDGDAAGDACDVCPADALDDYDADGVCGDIDNCPTIANADQANQDGDAAGDVCDICPADPFDDNDADGVCGDVDYCPDTAENDPVDAGGCSDVQVDEDADGVCDPDAESSGPSGCVGSDECAATVIAEGVPTLKLGTNRWALVDDNFIFDTTAPKGRGPGRAYSTADTSGCSCEQIIAACGYGSGHTRNGCSISVMDWWTGLYDRAGEPSLRCH